MCLALPVRVVEVVDDDQARVDVGGVQKVVNISLVDDLEEGDYVILHVGFAINRLDQAEAERTLELFREMAGTEAHT
ncbi:HypC/HybG/HupF family hydrogenase formation chaperone [Thioalkalivibrio sp. ALJT]|uniref:HypC/HybG/HupF family hydrogenase formation chaperone n=1 Tax=Thioalkalivibrio sp. ALJT TaxID=1158146 RepID=UPI0003727668|nr:HypC/HybG/HupF family hydrogenase formation chaperone [Thioalkalivibrio sp. ALJT]